MHVLSWMQIYNRNCQSALYQRVLQISVTADTRKDEWKRGGGRFWLLKLISNHVIMYSAAVTFFWSSVEDGVLISVILSSSLSKDIAVSPSWLLRGCVPVYSQRIYHLRWKATGSEAVSLRARGNKHKGFLSSKRAAQRQSCVVQAAGLLEELSLMCFTETWRPKQAARWCCCRATSLWRREDGGEGKLDSVFKKFHTMSRAGRISRSAQLLALGLSPN